MFIPRSLAGNLSAALNGTPVVLLAGARQTGKSTLVHSGELQQREYSSFDDV